MRTPRLRLLSAILAVALFFTLLPVSALAEGEEQASAMLLPAPSIRTTKTTRA